MYIHFDEPRGEREIKRLPSSDPRVKHGHARHGLKSSEFHSWQAMLSRCYRSKNIAYHNYGGRGITVCDRWRCDFLAFLADMGTKPTPKHEIDRINNDGNYEPTNCKWSTRLEQVRNKRSTRLIALYGETRPAKEWAEISGLSYRMVLYRLRAGWEPERAIFQPPIPRNVRRWNDTWRNGEAPQREMTSELRKYNSDFARQYRSQKREPR